MTYGMLKEQISALLDLEDGTVATEGSLLNILNARITPAVRSVVRKVAMYQKGFVKRMTLEFVRDGHVALALLPADFISAIRLQRAGKAYGRESFVPEGNNLRLLSGGAGAYELTYYAYPAFTDMEADADTEIGLDDFASDAIAYGAAAELCQNIYPGDMTRYMRLVTEWEERIAHICPTSAETKISNTVFTKERRHV